MRLSRRRLLSGASTATAAASAHSIAPRPVRAGPFDVIVVGAGVFGAWSAEQLRRSGRRVLLLDAWAPAHARASSGGESRMTRAGYGADALYTDMALRSLEDWQRLSDDQRLPLFHRSGVLMFFDGPHPYAAASERTLKELGIALERLEPTALARRWPQISWEGVAFGLFEPDFGALMARRAVAALVQQFVAGGGSYEQQAVLPPERDGPFPGLRTRSGAHFKAEQYVFACGPWLAKLFPELLGERLFATAQEIFYFQPPAGDGRFGSPALPGWAHFHGNDFFYGFPDLEGRGFKIADDAHGPIVDFDHNDRRPTATGQQRVRDYLAQRFPALAAAPLSEARVCQYENSASGDLLIDRHPEWPEVVLTGMGSGHGFKHGPAVGAEVARLLAGGEQTEARLTLASKTERQQRSVH